MAQSLERAAGKGRGMLEELSWDRVGRLNRLAAACFATAKASCLAVAGLAFTSHRIAGGTCAVVAGAFVVASVVLCLKALQLTKALDRKEGTAL